MLVAICLYFVVVNPLRADPPFAMYLFPAGGQRGTQVDVLAGGACLNPTCKFEILGPGVSGPDIVKRTETKYFEGPLLPLPESQRAEDYPLAMAAKIAIAKDAPLGNRFVRMWTSQGVTAPLTFVVGDLPEMLEKEIPGDPIPVKVQIPVTINGRIYPREDTDVWTVSLKKGEPLFCSVQAAAIGSPLEARLTICDPSGKKVAESVENVRTDPTLSFTADCDGDYQVHITDTRNDGGPAFVYRLSLTRAPVATPRVEEQVVNESADVQTAPFAGKGTISVKGERDTWKLSASAGEAFDIDLQAFGQGSALLGVVTVLDASEKVLATAEVNIADPSVRFIAPTAGTYTITVADRFKSRGGPNHWYRLRVTPSKPDFDLQVAVASLSVLRGGQSPLKLTATRRGGFVGPIFVLLDGLPAGVTPAKDPVFAATQPALDLQLKADAAAKIDSTRMTIKAFALSPATGSRPFIELIERSCVFKAPEGSIDHVRVAVALPTPFKIAGDYLLQLVPRGTQYSRHYRIERTGYDGPIEIDLAERQARHLQGVQAKAMTVGAGETEFEYHIQLPPWMETGRTCRVCVMGTAVVKDADGSEHYVTYSSKEQNDQMIAVIEPERLSLTLERQAVRLEPGKEIVVPLKIGRGENLNLPVSVELAMPDYFKGVAATPLQIPTDKADGELRIRVAPDAKGPFNMPLVLRAVAKDGGKPVVAEAKIEVIGK